MKKLFAYINSKSNYSQLQKNNLSDNQDTFKEAILVFLGLLALTILIRLPSFFRYLDLPDEATFILMAQSILDGHLPYTELWDIKPPLAFFIFTFPIILFGKSLPAVRLYAAIYIPLSGLAVYFLGKRVWNYRTGIISGILLTSIVALGTVPNKVMEMTNLQKIVIAPLAASLMILSISKISPKMCLLTGVLMGLSITLRPNLIYVAPTVAFAIFLIAWKQISRSFNNSIYCTFSYGVGIGVIIFLNYFPYLITGYHQLWWNSVVLASLSYSNTPLSMLGAGAAQARYLLQALSSWSHAGVNLLVWLGGLGGMITLLLRWKNLTQFQRIAVEFLFIFLIATEISILRGGRSFSSYHIQIYPFLSLASAVFLDLALSRITRSIAIITLILSFFSMIPLLLSEYQVLATRMVAGKSPNQGIAYEIAEYLKKENYSGEPIFMLNCHIVYWLLNTKPLSKSTTQPYNIVNGNLLQFIAESEATSESELAKILAQEPKYIIAKGGFKGELDLMFKKTLRNDYELIKKIENIKIYRINKEKTIFSD